jgi:hypothetical protein
MARVGLVTRTRLVVLGALVAAWMLSASDAEAQRRRRRRRTPTQTTTQSTTPTTPAGTQTTAAAGGDGDGDGDGDAPATTGTATTSTAATTNAATQPAQSTSAATTSAAASTTTAASTEPARAVEQPAQPSALRPGPAALDARLGFAAVGRSFWYTDDLFMQLRPYSLAIAPAINAAVEWYPGAHFSRGVASMFGLVADGQFTLLFGSSDSQGRTYPTLAYNFNAGLRTRLWLLDRIDIGLLLGFSMQNFSIDRSAVMLAPAEGIANTTYMGLRAGLTGRAQIIERFAVTAGSTWQYVLSGGEITSSEYFSRASVMAVDFSLGGAVALAKGLEVRLSADWRRYFFAMNPMPGDPLVAGGAVDDNYGLTASIAIRR